MRKKLVLAALIALGAPAIVVSAIAAPDVAPSLISVTMYQHAIEQDDVYLVAKYSMDYTVNPTEPISTTFFARLVDNTTATELGSVAPYPYRDLGYSRGIFAIYWPAASTSKPTWGSTNYTLRLEGNPTMAWTPSVPLATLGASSFSWQTTGTVSATSYIVGQDVVALANELGSYWNVSLLTPVNTGGVNGNVLTSSGDAYFSNAIPGLRTIAPTLFAVSSQATNYSDTQNTQTRASTLAARRASLGLYEGSVWGIPTDVIYALSAIIISLVFGALIVAMLAPLGGAMAQVGGGVVGSTLMLGFIPLLFTYVGLLSAIVEGILAFIAVIAIGLWLAGHLGRVA